MGSLTAAYVVFIVRRLSRTRRAFRIIFIPLIQLQ